MPLRLFPGSHRISRFALLFSFHEIPKALHTPSPGSRTFSTSDNDPPNAPLETSPRSNPDAGHEHVHPAACAPSVPSATSVPSNTDTHIHNTLPLSRLNPQPEDYRLPSFSDRATLTLHAGPGGNGCISFLRDLHFGGTAQGPPNGGDGGHGGNIYIASVYGETSLHKLGKSRVLRAGKGKSGTGSSRDGPRGADYVITVPVGTVVREVSRQDPVADELALARERRQKRKAERKRRADEAAAKAVQTRREGPLDDENSKDPDEVAHQARIEQDEQDWKEYDYPHYDKWVFYPGISATEKNSIELPKLPNRERLFTQPEGPINLDLMKPTKKPILLAAGGLGGLGNTHFHHHRNERPLIATKGEKAVSMKLELELKLLADVGLVGLPNAGKSTLLRAMTNSRARVGSWAFTTLQPNIGTVVLDSYKGRALALPKRKRRLTEEYGFVEKGREARTRFTIADIPGLIEGAHLDKGLGIAFLRHVERAAVLAFVVDLGAGPAVESLKALWREVGLYAQMREEEDRVEVAAEKIINWDYDSETAVKTWKNSEILALEEGAFQPLDISGKPWFVIATKGDLPGTEINFRDLKRYVEGVNKGEFYHPSGGHSGWTQNCAAIPVSAINGHGMEGLVNWIVGLLD